jgi:hypothetical protein
MLSYTFLFALLACTASANSQFEQTLKDSLSLIKVCAQLPAPALDCLPAPPLDCLPAPALDCLPAPPLDCLPAPALDCLPAPGLEYYEATDMYNNKMLCHCTRTCQCVPDLRPKKVMLGSFWSDIGKAFKDAAKAISVAADVVGKWTVGAGESAGKWVAGAGTDAVKWAAKAGSAVCHTSCECFAGGSYEMAYDIISKQGDVCSTHDKMNKFIDGFTRSIENTSPSSVCGAVVNAFPLTQAKSLAIGVIKDALQKCTPSVPCTMGGSCAELPGLRTRNDFNNKMCGWCG